MGVAALSKGGRGRCDTAVRGRGHVVRGCGGEHFERDLEQKWAHLDKRWVEQGIVVTVVATAALTFILHILLGAFFCSNTTCLRSSRSGRAIVLSSGVGLRWWWRA
jgi:hypothetical protein